MKSISAKTYIFGLLTASAFGLLSLPAYAQNFNGASVNQGSTQLNSQLGVGNINVQGSSQDADVNQNNSASFFPTSNVNGTLVNQGSTQLNSQFGAGNLNVQGSSQDANVNQNNANPYIYILPY